MGSVVEINGKCYDIGSEFVEKQIFDMVVDDIKIEVKKLNKVIKTQNNLIDKLKHFETDNIANLIELDTQIKKLKENKDRADFASECFIKQIKIEKNTKINNANIHLLEMRMDNVLDNKINNILERKIYNIELRLDNIDKFIQNILIKIKLIEKHCKN